ncbi:MAG: hypothetical protein RIR01_2325 [Bacteroidota bacterium]|jgi:hypothetical protein
MKLQKEDGYYYLMEEGNDIAIATTDQSFIDELGAMKLSQENCDEIFGVVDVEKLAKEEAIKISESEIRDEKLERIYKRGFNKAMELNKDKLFTVEDMRQAYDNGMDNIDADGCAIDNPDEDFFDTLRCIQQPKEIEVEIDMEKYGYCEGCRKAGMWHCAHADTCGYAETRERPKLDENGCLILKKK